jgi:hypothetical protein
MASITPLRVTASASWASMVEFAQDDPKGFELLAHSLSRKERPPWGSITASLREGKISVVETSTIKKST